MGETFTQIGHTLLIGYGLRHKTLHATKIASTIQLTSVDGNFLV